MFCHQTTRRPFISQNVLLFMLFSTLLLFKDIGANLTDYYLFPFLAQGAARYRGTKQTPLQKCKYLINFIQLILIVAFK